MSDRSRSALRWMPTFVGFPLGGLLAELVGPVDGVGHAVAGGALTGTILGVVQWLSVRRNGPPPEAWVGATAIGLAAGLGVGASVVDFDTDTRSLALQGAICGAAVGAAQAAVLYRRLGPVVLGWPVALAGIWALGWTITASIGVDVDAHYTVFGSSGALVVTALTSVIAIALAAAANPPHHLTQETS